MVIDARTKRGDRSEIADVCVIGGGPAGLSLARELSRATRSLVLLESGGPEQDRLTQRLAEGEVAGDAFPPLTETRRRQMGGTTHLWNPRVPGGRLSFRAGALDEIDFAARDWIPNSGWPFARETLDPYYRRAHELCELGPYTYAPELWETPRAPRLPLNDRELHTTFWHCGPQDTFATRLPAALADLPGVTIYQHANVVALEDNGSGKVSRVEVATLAGTRFTVSARIFVLAAGGIENARLLLLSELGRPQGVGNRHGIVGRYFMEHQLVRCGTLYPADPALMDRAGLYDVVQRSGTEVMGKLTFSAEFQNRERLVNVNALLLPRHRRYRPDSSESARAIGAALARGRLPSHAFSHLGRALTGFDFLALGAARRAFGRPKLMPLIQPGPRPVGDGGWSELPDLRRRYSAFDVHLHTEQAPDPDNRVELSGEIDELGCRRARLVWHWDALSRDGVSRATALLARSFAEANIGRLTIEEIGGSLPLVMPGMHHHMGTTRMHPSPSRGVVDSDCRVHGVENLYVAGSSVFPTGGCINPTLTIVALALRLGDHLATRLSGAGHEQVSGTAC